MPLAQASEELLFHRKYRPSVPHHCPEKVGQRIVFSVMPAYLKLAVIERGKRSEYRRDVESIVLRYERELRFNEGTNRIGNRLEVRIHQFLCDICKSEIAPGGFLHQRIRAPVIQGLHLVDHRLREIGKPSEKHVLLYLGQKFVVEYMIDMQHRVARDKHGSGVKAGFIVRIV